LYEVCLTATNEQSIVAWGNRSKFPDLTVREKQRSNSRTLRTNFIQSGSKLVALKKVSPNAYGGASRADQYEVLAALVAEDQRTDKPETAHFQSVRAQIKSANALSLPWMQISFNVRRPWLQFAFDEKSNQRCTACRLEALRAHDVRMGGLRGSCRSRQRTYLLHKDGASMQFYGMYNTPLNGLGPAVGMRGPFSRAF
jgi:hypothetical protein